MKPYNLAAPKKNHAKVGGHSRTCPLCGDARPFRRTSRKTPRQLAKLAMKETLPRPRSLR